MNRKQVWSLILILVGITSLLGQPTGLRAANGWYAEYFNNTNLSGSPVLTRNEAGLYQDWGTGSPGGGVPADNFSARFTQDIGFAGGTYRFSYRSDDGLRLWVGGTLVIDSWREQTPTWRSLNHYVPAGTHRVRVEYYEQGGGAMFQVGWEPVGSGANWQGVYYANRSLSGSPALVRQDAAINFSWGNDSPAPEVPADNFSVRWTRTLGFTEGTYRFYASSDDGVRVYVDGQRILDVWRTQQLPNTHYAERVLSSGQHTVVVEYFEEGGEASVHVWWDRLDTISGWEGRYYSNPNLRGGPALIRDDEEINFDWGDGAPVSWMPNDHFSVRWIQTFDLKPGLYRFNARMDDGLRLWIDDVDLRLNHWEPQDYVWHYQDWHYLEGEHTLRVEYFDQTGPARVQFWWDYAPTVEAAQAMPPSPTYGFKAAPAPAATPTPTPRPGSARPTPQPTVVEKLPGPWQGEYFANRNLTGDPVLVRTDPTIDFTWSWDAPAPEVPEENFSVRWTGTFTFPAGRYRFRTMTDDGVRVFVDGRRILNSWWRMRGTRYAYVNLEEGEHEVRVEYFEATQAAQAHVTWARIGDLP